MTNPNLKLDAVMLVMPPLAQLPFQTIYSYADNLFDKNEVAVGDSSIQTEVDFLKTTRPGDIVFEDTEKSHFKMRNTVTGESITVSNRASNRGELRGDLLRSHIEAAALSNPNQNTYDLIEVAVKSPKYSDMVTMLRGSFTGETAQKSYDGASMSVESFNLFVTLLANKINEKIATHQLPASWEPIDIRTQPELQEKIWEGIDVGAVYDESIKFDNHLQSLKEKAELFMQKGYVKAGQAAHSLYDELQSKKNDLQNGVINNQGFSNKCTHLIEQAEQGELRKHPGVFDKILHSIRNVLNAITFGGVSVKPVECMEKTKQMRDSLKSLTSAGPIKQPVEKEQSEARSSVSLGG